MLGWSRRRRERELQDELAFHLEQAARGATPRQAAARLGGLDAIQEECREQWAWSWLAELGRDVRLGWRSLRRSPGFAIVATLSLALAIGANTAIFSCLDNYYFFHYPFPHASRIVQVVSTDPHGEILADNPVWAGDVEEFRDRSGAFSGLADWYTDSVNFASGAQSARVVAMKVTANFFSVLGVAPAAGRGFLVGEDQPGHEREAVLSDGLWRGKLGGAAMLGESVTLDGVPYTVVGVMPPHFAVGVYQADLWIPFVLSPADLAHNSKTARSVQTVGRLRPGVSVQAAAGAVQALVKRLARRYPDAQHGWGETVVTLARSQQLALRVGGILTALLTTTGLILLVACGSVAGMLLERGAARAPEFAIRRALGATRARLLTQLLVEGGLIAVAAGVAGLALAQATLPWLNANLGGALGRNLRLDVRVLAFTAAVAAATALLAGLGPAWRSSAVAPGQGRRRGRGVLVAAELALALVCLAGTAAMVQSVRQDLTQSLGYQPQDVLIADLNLAGPAYASPAARAAMDTRLVRAAAVLPGVWRAALVSPPPISWYAPAVQARGHHPQTMDNGPLPQVLAVTPQYFRLLQIPLRAGREFSRDDALRTAPVVIINQRAARRFFPGAPSAVGQYLRIVHPGEPPWREVVGEVADVRQVYGYDPEPAVYEPLAQAPQAFVGVMVRGSGAPLDLAPELRAALARLDPALPLFSLGSLQEKLLAAYGGSRSLPALLAFLDGLVLLLGAIGLYGLVAYAASRRRRELAIRMALGSSPGGAQRLLLWSGLRPALLGAGAGLGLAWLDSYLLAHLFPGLPTRSLLLLGGPTALLLAVAALASFLPARRAAHCQPLEVLKEL